jgi:L-2,4-diaminobutyrate decarboxylase
VGRRQYGGATVNTHDHDGFDHGRDPARMHRYDPSTEALAQAVVHYALDRVRLDPPPLDGPRTKADLDRLGPTITADGLGGMEALRLFCEHLAPATISQDHPRAVSFVPTAPTEAAVLFDLVVGASSIYAGSWMEGSGAVWAENQALRWIADLAGMPESAGGVFVSGGTAGNLSALVAARDAARRRWGDPVTKWYVFVGAGAHSSIASAARVMDIGVIKVPSDSDGRLRAEDLRASIRLARAEGIAVGDADRHAGFAADVPATPRGIAFAVAATGGTTNLGLVDDLAGVSAITREEDLWFHVDGAYGGAALAAPSVRHLFNGIEWADSFIVDPHKWLFAPFDCCALLYRDPPAAARAHAQHAAYLDVLHDDGDWNPSDYAAHLTRRARGLPLWYSLATHGTDAYTDAVEAGIAVTHAIADEIRSHPHLALLCEPELSVVVFRRLGWAAADYHEWSDRMLAEQRAFCVPTSVMSENGEPETVLRFCVVNPRTTLADLCDILSTLR